MGAELQLSIIEMWRQPLLLPPVREVAYYVLAAASLVLLLLTVWHSRRGYWARRWPVSAVIVLAPSAMLAQLVFVLQVWPSAAYGWLTAGKGLNIPLLGMLPLILGAAYCGPIEAVVVGLSSSLAYSLWFTHNPLTCLVGAFLALVLNHLLRLPYRGRLPSALRGPVLAAPLAVILIWPILVLASHATIFGHTLTSIATAIESSLLTGATYTVQAWIAAFLLQLLYFTPLGRPVPVPSRTPPYAQSLRAKVLSAYVPTATFVLLVVLGTATYSAIVSARRWALAEAARDASSAAHRLGRALDQTQIFLSTYAPIAGKLKNGQRQTQLEQILALCPTLSAVLLVDDSGDILAAHPENIAGQELDDAELQAIANQTAETTALTTIHRSASGPAITLISPATQGLRLLGRINPTQSQTLQDIVGDLQWTLDAGNGFVVDDDNRIVAHPDASYIMAQWDANLRYARRLATGTGAAYDAPDSSGTRHLLYVLPVASYPWRVVIEVPSETILQEALQLALPMLALASAVSVAGTLLVWIGAWRYSRPLVRLAATAGEIAAGDLTVPIEVSGHDEIGHLGRSFEEMRRSLHRRLSDLSMLLDVVRSVSASQDWSFQPILHAATHGTQAIASCICLDEGPECVPVAQEGDFAGWGEILPHMRHIAQEAQKQRHPLPVRSVARYMRHASPETLTAGVRSAVCLPLNSGDRVVGVMWVLYANRRHFDTQEVQLLSTLAAQAAVVYENARLLAQAQSERGRLHAILVSTTDPIIVIDGEGRLVLANPAAEHVLGIETDKIGTLVSDMITHTSMRILLDMPLRGSSATRELHLDDGRTLYASIAPVVMKDGSDLGRVIVMRDITELKTREQAQADFVTTLSRDLHQPLILLRGYANMLPRVGDLNTQQADFVERITENVDFVAGLVDNLVDLKRIELGEGATLERCSVAGAIEAALATLRLELEDRAHSVRLSLPETPAIVESDRNLLVRALVCLLDNAIKYTPSGGTIGIEVSADNEGVSMAVTDNGIGIAPTDQLRLFDRFFRVDRPEVMEVPGYGLGLSIVRAIAEWHGGRVWLESELGNGSRFYLWLPRHRRGK